MPRYETNINKKLLLCIYLYLALPVVVFFLGWCKWYIGIPLAIITAASVLLCIREHKQTSTVSPLFTADSLPKFILALALIMIWVALSGVGGYFWQNTDHPHRSAIFETLITDSWPIIYDSEIEGVVQERGFTYYIGFWMPASVIGKFFGVNAGYSALYIWAVLGIALFYLLICNWQKQIKIWPLLVLTFFSGADVIGTLLTSTETFPLFGANHLERWPLIYQYSSMTTQLFWVFNQAIPAWIASALIFLNEKPKNMIFVCALLMLSSTFPFIGLLPFVVYFLIYRSKWNANTTLGQLFQNLWNNWASIQNLLGGCTVGIITFLYLFGNASGKTIKLYSQDSGLITSFIVGAVIVLILVLLAGIYLCLKGKTKIVMSVLKSILILVLTISFIQMIQVNNTYDNTLYRYITLGIFFILEVGVYLFLLKDTVKEVGLYWVTVISLLVIPLVIVGSSIDFCMRASIPAMVLIILWIVNALQKHEKNFVFAALIVLLLVGSITPLHEMKRTLVSSREEYILKVVTKEELLAGSNFSGSTDGFFWKYIAK